MHVNNFFDKVFHKQKNRPWGGLITNTTRGRSVTTRGRPFPRRWFLRVLLLPKLSCRTLDGLSGNHPHSFSTMEYPELLFFWCRAHHCSVSIGNELLLASYSPVHYAFPLVLGRLTVRCYIISITYHQKTCNVQASWSSRIYEIISNSILLSHISYFYYTTD